MLPSSAMRLASLALALSIGCGDNLAADPSGPLALRFEPVTLSGPPPLAITSIGFVPGTDVLLVLNKTRTVTYYRLERDGLHATRLGEFDVPGVDETADCGLLAVAFDPAFASNRQVYFAACESTSYSRITRHVLDLDDPSRIAATTFTVIRVGRDAATKGWHNVGSIGFDRDGYLWALFGDKNDAYAAQDRASNLGAVLRIAPSLVGDGYVPAPDNPFVGIADSSPDIAAHGLRSPWRGALDDRGRLWIGDVGDNSFEEVNVSRLAGENFGAGRSEGPCTAQCDGLVDPIVSWDRSLDHRYADDDPDAERTTRRVVWIGAAYPRDVAEDRYAGRLFDRMLVGDFCTGWIRAIGLDDSDRVIADEPAGHLVAASGWAIAPDGHLYVSVYGNALAWPYVPGALYRTVLAKP